MLQIAICDDLPKDLVRVETMIYEYLERKSVDAKVDTFSHPDDLLEASEQRKYQIMLLDIVMPMYSGIDVGREIRKKDQSVQIIFCTSEASFALEAYDANPTHYLLKPLEEDRFFRAMDLAVKNVEESDRETVVIKTKSGYQTLEVEEILYMEYTNHTVRFVMKREIEWITTTIKGNFTEYVKSLIASESFIKTHMSYVVNMDGVEKISSDGFKMENGDMIPISRSQYGSVRDSYLDYRLGVQ